MLIDFENHLYMEEQLIQKTHSPSGVICERFWDDKANKIGLRVFKEASEVERFLKFMDDAGIDIAVLTNHGSKSLEQTKRWNDYCADVVKKYPKRFIGFAWIPAEGGKPALDELDRAINVLGMKGVHIVSRPGEYHLDSRELWPFYEKVSKLDVPIDVHVATEPSGFDALAADYGLYYTLARELDMCAATIRVCLGGVLEDFPDLKFIMNHFGGGVSSVIERVDSYVGFSLSGFYKGKPLISKPWREYFNKLYFNIAGREVGMETVKCALTNISPKRLVFGTDWPFNYDYYPQEVKRFTNDIKKLGLTGNSAEDILGNNAARLLGITA